MSRRRQLRAAALVGTALWCASGCSVVFSYPPPPYVPRIEPRCRTSPAPPIIDTLASAATLVAALKVHGDRENPDRGLDTILSGGAAVALAASAIYGYKSMSDCRDMKEAVRLQHQLAPPPPPPPYSGGPPGPPPAAPPP